MNGVSAIVGRKFIGSAGFGAAILLASTALASGALAQTAPTPAAPPTREEIQRDRLEDRLRTEGQAVAVDGAIERAPCPLAAPEFAGLTFTFTQARFSGLEAIGVAIVEPAYAELVGQELSVAAICDIRDRAGTLLRQQGYLAAVQVPVQQIEGGVVRFDVVLARMSAVQVRGEPGPSGRLLQKYIDKLSGQPVFNINEAERYLLLARDIPGLDVRLTLQPVAGGPETVLGDVVGVFNVDRTPVFADLAVQNYGSKEVGRFGALARVQVNGITGMGDETTASFYVTEDFDEQRVLQLGHEFRLGGEGLRLGANGTFAWSQPDIAGPDLFESETMIVSAYAGFPLRRSQVSNLFAAAGFDLIDQDVSFTGLPLSKDRLRVAYARVDFNRIDRPSLTGSGGYSAAEPRFAVAGGLEVRQGFDVFGASQGCGPGFVLCTAPGADVPSRLDGDPTALVVRASGRADFRPVPDIKFSIAPRAQYSPDALLSYEQVSGGNFTSGRGYDPGAVIGDSGIGAQVEAAYGSLVPGSFGGTAWQPYVFYDFMAVDTNNLPGGFDTISSAGGGVRAALGNRLRLDVFGAVPLERAPFQTQRGDFRLLINLSVQLVPWR
ncbi:ShlB/FhaC/HecB family hemolysin secretion/activation protein [Allopontixanthobacter sp.]|uniref:ShlB/FhaC/HecB family hemolysin secretion/activation protein n=1 Tax=Allopontixanthobacter sp. TaxID=2906452 RepID=UPI002ABB0535|nr:ShlB/FhaC/HecB family hemolysin secretion/activation protein [Allopontixanthobacter sp.]MDZ4308633.1 ShlB/FhaC/HecB family hemolysin secretion/activation protein [Allopontixanthobacter sp.]